MRVGTCSDWIVALATGLIVLVLGVALPLGMLGLLTYLIARLFSPTILGLCSWECSP